MNLQDELRETLRYAAADLSVSPPPPEFSAQMMGDERRRRTRHRAGLLAAGLAVVMVIVAVPLGLSWLGKTTRTAEPPPAEMYTVPTRGSLAGDREFVDAVRQLPWDVADSALTGIAPPQPDSRHVVFAGDVPGGRWALVVGPEQPGTEGSDAEPSSDGKGFSAAWYVGPEGATPDQLSQQSPPSWVLPSRRPTWRLDAKTGTLVVIAAPGDIVQISDRPVVASDGSVTRTFRSVDTVDGVAVVQVEPELFPARTPIRVQVIRDGDVMTETQDLSWTDPSAAPPPITVHYVRGEPTISEYSFSTDTWMVGQILGAVGLDPADAQLSVLWVGEIPGPGGIPGQLTVLTAMLPSGAVVVTAAWGRPYGGGSDSMGADLGGYCVEQVQPSGEPATDRVYAMRCDVVDGTVHSDTVSSLVVVGPSTVVSVEALNTGGDVLGTFPAVDGVVVASFLAGTATVRPLLADGSELEPVLLGQNDPGYLD